MKTDREIFNDFCKIKNNGIGFMGFTQKELEQIEKSNEFIKYKYSVRWNEFKIELMKTVKIIKGWFNG